MKILTAYFNRLAAEVDRIILHPEVSEDLQQTLSRGMGWDRISNLWRFIEVDADGRQYVSTDATKAATGANSAVSVGVASTQILAANPLRKYFVIYNNGTVDISIEYDSVAVLADGLIIPSGGMFSDDGYVGAIYGISSLAAQDLRVLEV